MKHDPPSNRTPPTHPSRLPSERDPWLIVHDTSLDRATKLDRLRQLEYDVRQAQVATEEGMEGPAPLPSLALIRAAMVQLGPEAAPEVSPTKI